MESPKTQRSSGPTRSGSPGVAAHTVKGAGPTFASPGTLVSLLATGENGTRSVSQGSGLVWTTVTEEWGEKSFPLEPAEGLSQTVELTSETTSDLSRSPTRTRGDGAKKKRILSRAINMQPNETYKENRNPYQWSPSQEQSKRNRNRVLRTPDKAHEEIKIHNRFYVLQTTDEKTTMDDLCEFKMYSDLKLQCKGEPENIKITRDGKMLIRTKNQEQSSHLLKMNRLAGVPINVEPHEKLNTTKGTIIARKWEKYTSEELCQHLKSEGVIDVKMLKSRPDKKYLGERYLLTFNRMEVPEKIRGGLQMLSVREYIPRPRRCFKCQGFGHVGKHCRKTKDTCVNCSDYAHTPENECRRKPYCRNCGGEHPANSMNCPTYKKEQEILTIVTKEKISFQDARKRVRARYPQTNRSYADTVRAKSSQQNQIQQDREPFVLPTRLTKDVERNTSTLLAKERGQLNREEMRKKSQTKDNQEQEMETSERTTLAEENNAQAKRKMDSPENDERKNEIKRKQGEPPKKANQEVVKNNKTPNERVNSASRTQPRKNPVTDHPLRPVGQNTKQNPPQSKPKEQNISVQIGGRPETQPLPRDPRLQQKTIEINNITEIRKEP